MKLELDQITEKVAAVVAHQFGYYKNDILAMMSRGRDDLADDLGSDLIDHGELVISIENAFEVTFSGMQAMSLDTVRDLVALVDSVLNGGLS